MGRDERISRWLGIMEKELRLSFDDPRLHNSMLITGLIERRAKELGLDTSKNDCVEVVDDYDARMRIIRFKTRTTTVY